MSLVPGHPAPSRAGPESASPGEVPRSVAPRAGAALQDTGPVALVPAGGVYVGEVAVIGRTRIEGRVVGSLRGPGVLELGPAAVVEGEIECREVRSEGAIRGPVRALERLALGPRARLEGDLEAPRVEVADHAVWNGVARVGGATEKRAPKDVSAPSNA